MTGRGTDKSENSKHLPRNVYYVLNIVRSALHIVIHLLLRVTAQDMHYYYPHFTDKKTKRLNNPPKVTQLVDVRPGIHIQTNHLHCRAQGHSSATLFKRSMIT